MGKATTDLKNRLKAVALARRKLSTNKYSKLSIAEELNECKAYINLCRADMEMLGKSTVIINKMKMYEDKIIELKEKLKND